MQNLIPKSLNKQKRALYKNITWNDIIVFVVYLAISIGSSMGIVVINIGFRFLIAAIIMLLLMITMIYLKNQNCRIYTYIWYIFKYKVNVKLYTKTETKYNSKNLIPYSTFNEKNYIVTRDSKEYKYSSRKEYIAIFKIKGIDLTILDPEDEKAKLENFHTLIKNIKTSFSLAKVNQKTVYNQQLKNIDDLIIKNYEQYTNLEISMEMYQSKLKQLENDKQNLINISNSHQNLSRDMFVILYSYKENQLDEICHDFIKNAESVNLFVDKLTPIESINFIKNIFNPYTSDINSKILKENIENINELLSFNNIKFNKNHFCINEHLLCSVQTVNDFPMKVNDYWLAYLFLSVEANIMMNISQMSLYEARRLINKAIVNSSVNKFSSKKYLEVQEQDLIVNGFKQLADQIADGSETIKYTNLLFLNYANDIKQLNKLNLDLKQKLANKNIIINKLHYRQFEGLLSFIPRTIDGLMQMFGREIPSHTISNGFPFILNPINDPKGMMLGVDSLGCDVNFDLFAQNDQRKNHNGVVVGSSGSGKSYFLKKLINWHVDSSHFVYVFDPEREYKEICKYYNGTWIDCGSGDNGVINPLQIYVFDNNESNISSINNHLNNLSNFFKILFNYLNEFEIELLIYSISELYMKMGYDKVNLKDLENNKFPRFIELHQFMIKNKNLLCQKYSQVFYNNVINCIENNLINYGKYANMYNKHSNINLKTKFVVFDINSLFEQNNKSLIQAQMFLVLNYLKNLINRSIDNEKKLIVIDEGHLLIDENNPIALDFLYQIAKRIRKHSGGLWFATQNIEDFNANQLVAKKSMAILNNSQYSLFFNLSPSNINSLKHLYSSCGNGLSEAEQLYIAKARRGQCLFVVSNFDRHQVEIKVNNFEINAFENKQ